MTKGLGRFLGRGSFTVHTGGSGFISYHLKLGDLVSSCSLPDRGVYEVESSNEPCSYKRCGFQGSTVRRVNMRYLNKKQRQNIIDISPQIRGSLQK